MTDNYLQELVKKVVQDILEGIPVEVSARHIHLSQEHLELLFGKDYQLTPMRPLSQPGQFAAQETVTLVNSAGVLQDVRILGPSREHTQVELAFSDARKLGLRPPVRESGNISGSPGIVIIGPKGFVEIKEGVIVACRHLHATPEDSKRLGIKDGDIIEVEVTGDRPGILGGIIVRVSNQYDLALHLDVDEANAFGITQGFKVKIYKRR